MILNKDAVKAALASVIKELDYDYHKELEFAEDGEDDYPYYVEVFVAEYLINELQEEQ